MHPFLQLRGQLVGVTSWLLNIAQHSNFADRETRHQEISKLLILELGSKLRAAGGDSGPLSPCWKAWPANPDCLSKLLPMPRPARFPPSAAETLFLLPRHSFRSTSRSPKSVYPRLHILFTGLIKIQGLGYSSGTKPCMYNADSPSPVPPPHTIH